MSMQWSQFLDHDITSTQVRMIFETVPFKDWTSCLQISSAAVTMGCLGTMRGELAQIAQIEGQSLATVLRQTTGLESVQANAFMTVARK
ncbi:hypothetical protein PoB_001512300 [Plakobranchus ocellatus]|uniref:Uncharacterized protein n=1 Tax=Plakobranchus ocellatus TaxID=259542 RepID=A0AAV3Z1Y8_9GAST|nr:hypothetical protein PoB_001512300 [Plakobranchus ocellatus]